MRVDMRTVCAATVAISKGLSSVAMAQEAGPASEEQVPVAEAHAVEVERARKWSDDLTIGAFVDAYGALRSDNNQTHNKNGSETDFNSALGLNNPGQTGAFAHDAYVEASGFALAFAGADIAYSGDQFGATISLRFGPGVNRFYGADQGPFGINNMTQAYLTWKPALVKGLTLDLGQFYTLIGAEVAESWRNMNYSRGGLYYAMQPFWHTGVRANYVINDAIAVNAMVVNGVNAAFEGNKSPTIGLQLVLTPMDELFIAAGYMGDLTPRDGDDETSPTKNFEDFFDVIATVTVGDFKVVNNFDFNLYKQKGTAYEHENWWGISAAPGYTFSDWMGIAGRVEYLSDSNNAVFAMKRDKTDMAAFVGSSSSVVTLTGTLDFKPIPDKSVLILRPEFRYEMASDYLYTDHDDEATKHFYQAVLGAVVTSM